MNWFIALKGRVEAVAPGDTVNMATAAAYRELRAAVGVDAVIWRASSPSVVGVAGFGVTPEDAIRGFEERMALPSVAAGGLGT